MTGTESWQDDRGRQHLRHGPIHLIMEYFGSVNEISHAAQQAGSYFVNVLNELVGELEILRRPINEAYPFLRGPVAQAMARAVWPLRDDYVTPMAAVAGAVADGVLAAAVDGRTLVKAYANNGGDIALHLSPQSHLDAGVIADISCGGLAGQVRLDHLMPVRGVATSGWRGRSCSRGIADAVTVLSPTAAQADAAATIIANWVDVDHPAIERIAANELDPDTDLGSIPVTVAVAPMSVGARRSAVLSGVNRARGLLDKGVILGAMIALGDQAATVGAVNTEDLLSREGHT